MVERANTPAYRTACQTKPPRSRRSIAVMKSRPTELFATLRPLFARRGGGRRTPIATARPPTSDAAKLRITRQRRAAVSRPIDIRSSCAVSIALRRLAVIQERGPGPRARASRWLRRGNEPGRRPRRLPGSLWLDAGRLRPRGASPRTRSRARRRGARAPFRLQGRGRLRRRAEGLRAADAGELGTHLRDLGRGAAEPARAEARRPERPERLVAALGRLRHPTRVADHHRPEQGRRVRVGPGGGRRPPGARCDRDRARRRPGRCRDGADRRPPSGGSDLPRHAGGPRLERAPGTPPEHALDGDPATAWRSAAAPGTH